MLHQDNGPLRFGAHRTVRRAQMLSIPTIKSPAAAREGLRTQGKLRSHAYLGRGSAWRFCGRTCGRICGIGRVDAF